MRDPKDVYNEAYSEAIEGGYSPIAAHDIAEEARIDVESSNIDDAMNRMKELHG